MKNLVMDNPILTVIKLGGSVTDIHSPINSLVSEIATLVSQGSRILIIHGGGAEVTNLSRAFGSEPKFIDGIRITSTEEMEYVDMVLCGKINKRLVRICAAHGISAIGLSGSDGPIFTGIRTGVNSEKNHTARVDEVDCSLLDLLFENDYLPIIAPTTFERPGLPVNINADSVALMLSPVLQAENLIFLSDVSGVLKEGKILTNLTPKQALNEIDSGWIKDGMIPKIKSAVTAVRKGVKRVMIGAYKEAGDLDRLIDGNIGTSIERSENEDV